MDLRSTVIVSAARTAGGRFGGSLTTFSATELGAAAIRAAVEKSGFPYDQIDQVIMGNGWQAGVGPNPARIAGYKSGLPQECPAFSVNIRCGSGLRAVQLGALSIAAGETDIVVAGGMESASNVPFTAEGVRWGARMGDQKLTDLLHRDGFMCLLSDMMMGNTGELLAEKYGISRAEQDEFALSSHVKAANAIQSGAFKDEIVPLDIHSKKGIRCFETDEIPKPDADIEKMSKLPAIFQKDGTVTAANSSALCDGASAMVLAAEETAQKHSLAPLARILSYSFIAIDPKYMGEGPINAIGKALKIAGREINDIDLFEINEAFAVQVLACNRILKIDPGKINVCGGAIALGHPVGATGAKILTTLAYALKNQDKRYGAAALCVGGGQGLAMIIERI